MKVVPAVVSAVPQFPVPMPVVKLSWLGCGLKPQQPARVVLVDVLVDVEVDVLVVLVVTGALVVVVVVEDVVRGPLVEVDVLVELVVTGALVEVDVLVELVVTGPVDVVVEDVRQGLCAQEPVPMEKAPGCLAQLAGVNCPHSSVPFSGMQQITLVGGPGGWAAASVEIGRASCRERG